MGQYRFLTYRLPDDASDRAAEQQEWATSSKDLADAGLLVANRRTKQ